MKATVISKLLGLLILALLVGAESQILFALDPSKPITQYGRDVWDSHRGFPYFAIHSMLQTRDGYIWLATDEGLIRFDGVQFSLFDKNNTPAITHNDISSLVEDTFGTLWFGTRGGGLCKLQAGKFTSYRTPDGLSGNIIHSLYRNQNNGLWIGIESSGLSKMSDGSFTNYQLSAISEALTVYAVYETRDRTVLIGAGGLRRKLPGSAVFESVPIDAVSFVKTILEDRNGLRWIGTHRGLFTLEGDRIIPCTLPGAPVSQSVTCLYEDRDGNLWVGTEGNGLYRLVNGVFTSFTMKDGLSSDRVLSLTEDREGNLWVGTRGGGLNRLRNQNIQTFSVEEGLSGEYVTAVYEDRAGTMWVGVKDAGVDEIRNGLVVHRYRVGQNPAANHVRAIEEDAGGNIILGTMKGVVFLKKTSSEKRVVIVPLGTFEKIAFYSIRSIRVKNNGDILFGTYGSGVWSYSAGNFQNTSTDGNVRSIIETSDGSFWVASKGGVSHVQGNVTKQFTPLDGLSNDESFSLYSEDDSTIWVGTYGGGLNRIRNGTVTPITKKDGLFDNVIYAILDDGNGNFWMSSNRGIFRVRKQDLHDFSDHKSTSVTCVSYGNEDGMRSVECNGGSQPSGWRTRGGNLLFATVRGFVIIDPKSVQSTGHEITSMVELIIAEGDTVLPGKEQTLPLGKRRLEVHYTGISFVGAEKITFRYRLEPVDGSWIEAGTRRRAYYTDVPPGKYLFTVKAESPDGRRGGTEASMIIVVPPYIWETAWFKVIGGVLLLFIVIGTARYISTRALKQRLRELEAQQALERERSRISQDMHDEVGASLTQIAILSALLERNMTNRSAAESYLKKISTTAHDVVGSLDEIVWFINPKHDTLESLLLYIREYLAGYFESAELQCKFEFPETIHATTLTADIRRNIFLVIKEAAHNIVKHAQAKSVTIQATVNDNFVEIALNDDGTGIPEENRSFFSNGMINMRKRMEDIGGLFDIASGEEKGTKVTIKAKVKSQK